MISSRPNLKKLLKRGDEMLLDKTVFFVKEHVGMLKLTDTYDILDPATQAPIGIAREEVPGWMKALRLIVKKQALPTTINIYEAEGQPPLVTLKKAFAFIFSKVRVFDSAGKEIGLLKSKLFSLGGGFWVLDTNGAKVAEVKGDWKGWNFKFLGANGDELGSVTKKWAGIGKELFTTADNYVISLTGTSNRASAALLLAAGLSIDMIFKEKK